MAAGGQHIILIGFMGAGKTSVGRKLSRHLSRLMVDTDQLIEDMAGTTISQIFATQGEEGFRKIESQVLQDLKDDKQPKIISTGGGLPIKEENRNQLRQMGRVIYLRVKPDTVLGRLKGDTTRPLLQGDNVREKVEELLAYRGPIYEEAADIVVDVDDKNLGKITEEIITKLK